MFRVELTQNLGVGCRALVSTALPGKASKIRMSNAGHQSTHGDESRYELMVEVDINPPDEFGGEDTHEI